MCVMCPKQRLCYFISNVRERIDVRIYEIYIVKSV